MDRELNSAWTKIEAWDAMYLDPELGSSLRPPAPQVVISALNRHFGGILPNAFLVSLAMHNGTPEWTTEFHNGRLLGVSEVVESLNQRRNIARELIESNWFNQVSAGPTLIPTGHVKCAFWSPSWVPIQETDWSVCCLDFDPAPGGVVGQVVEVYWEAATVKVIAKNYVDFLHLCANELPEEPLD